MTLAYNEIHREYFPVNFETKSFFKRYFTVSQ